MAKFEWRCLHCNTKVYPGLVYCDACRIVIYGPIKPRTDVQGPFSCPPPSIYDPLWRKR